MRKVGASTIDPVGEEAVVPLRAMFTLVQAGLFSRRGDVLVLQLQSTLPGPPLILPRSRKGVGGLGRAALGRSPPSLLPLFPFLSGWPSGGRRGEAFQSDSGAPGAARVANISWAVPRSSTGSPPTQGKRLSAASNHSEDSRVSGSTLSASDDPEEGREAQQPEGAAAEAQLEGGGKLVAEEKGQAPPEEVATLEETVEDQEEELELEYSEVGAVRPPKAALPRAPDPGRFPRCA